MNIPPAFLLGLIHMGKWGDKSISLERFGALCHSHSHGGETCSRRVPHPGASRNGPASMPVRTPTCGTRPGAVGAEDTGLLVLFSPCRLVLPLHSMRGIAVEAQPGSEGRGCNLGH